METNKTVLSDSQMRALVTRARDAKEQRFLELSRQRLDRLVSTKIRTAFIGALASFEESYGFLWGHGKADEDLTPEEKQMREVWNQTRTKVLNNGNAQMRAAQTEIANHVIKWNRYHMELPVKSSDVKE